MNLNARVVRLIENLSVDPVSPRVKFHAVEGGGRVIDCGIEAPGGLRVGIDLARVCLADLADVALVPGEIAGQTCPLVQIATDHPIAACLGSQYAGWQLSEDKFFAMGSGPMRAAARHEAIFETIGIHDPAGAVVGVLEGRKLPPPEIVGRIAEACEVDRSNVTLLIAPTASLAGTIQVVARSVETALHKLAELKFDLTRIVSGYGSAPLPPVAKDDLAAIGRTNDAVLYGARVILHVRGDDQSLAEIGPTVPSSASPDHGEPFATIFSRYDHDFYKVDPHLFSPAEIVFQNLDTGRSQVFGRVAPDVLERSFFG